MGEFKKSTTIKGSYKELVVMNGHFASPETGEEIDVADELSRIYGDAVFSLTTQYKADLEIEPNADGGDLDD